MTGAASGGAETERLARRLGEIGYRDLATYEAGFPEWAAAVDLDVASLARYEKLVPPGWLHDLLGGRPVRAAPAGEFVVCHVNYGVPAEYQESHLPGAVHLDTNTLESSRDWNRRPPQALEAALLELGITCTTTVIVYAATAWRTPPNRSRGEWQARSRPPGPPPSSCMPGCATSGCSTAATTLGCGRLSRRGNRQAADSGHGVRSVDRRQFAVLR